MRTSFAHGVPPVARPGRRVAIFEDELDELAHHRQVARLAELGSDATCPPGTRTVSGAAAAPQERHQVFAAERRWSRTRMRSGLVEAPGRSTR